MNNATPVLAFLLGTAAGAFVTWRFLEAKYKKIAQEEIDSMKEYYSRKYDVPKEEPEKEEDTPVVDATDIRNYSKTILEQGYTDYANNNLKPEVHEEEVPEMIKPYVIEPDEYGTLDDYDTISLTYYADGVLADDRDVRIEDVDDVVGVDSLDHFGEYEDDSVFVRNEERKADYEILLDEREYSDIINMFPHLAEDEW